MFNALDKIVHIMYNEGNNHELEEKILKIGGLVKEYREKNNLSQREFAKRCGVSNGYISMLEEGKNPKTNEPIVPALATYAKIAKALGITVNDLFVKMDDAPITIGNKQTTPTRIISPRAKRNS